MAFCLAFWLYNILVVNDVVNFGRLQDLLGHGKYIHSGVTVHM